MTSIGIFTLFIIVFSVIFNGLCKLFLHKEPLLGMDLSLLKTEDHQLRGEVVICSACHSMRL